VARALVPAFLPVFFRLPFDLPGIHIFMFKMEDLLVGRLRRKDSQHQVDLLLGIHGSANGG
jgi:hypothetical protein